MKYNKVTRRMFLQGTGSTLLSIPFLTSLVPREARGVETGPIKRYLSIMTNFNIGHNKAWFPTVNALPNRIPIPGNPNTAGYQRLTDFMQDGRTGLSRVITSAMNPFLNQMMLYKSLDHVSFGYHQWAHHLGASMMGLSASENGKVQTIDHFLAKNAKFDPSKRSAYHLGMGGGSVDMNALGQLVRRGSIAYNAWDAYRIIFNNGAYPESGGAPVANPRRDLLTRVLNDYRRVASGRQIGSTDRIILESVMDTMSDLQAGLTTSAIASCRHLGQDPTAANNKNEFLLDDALNYRNYITLIKAIFACDMTRVVTFHSDIANSYDNSGRATTDYHEGVTHAPYSQPVIDYMSSLYAKKMTTFIAPLLTELNSMIDPANGKSFLHNGLAQISMETIYTHRNVNQPTLTVGSFNDALPTGYMVDYGDRNRLFTFAGGTVNGATVDEPTDPLFSSDHPGIPYNRYLVTVLQAAGMVPADYERSDLNTDLLNRTDSAYGPQNNGITRVGGFGTTSMDEKLATDYHHAGRMSRYNFNYFKDPIPLPPRIG